MIPHATATISAVALSEIANNRPGEGQYVAKVSGKPVTVAQLRAAFEAVENKADWKGPIDAEVRAADGLLTAVAVEYFHGDFAEVLPTRAGWVRITSGGYCC